MTVNMSSWSPSHSWKKSGQTWGVGQHFTCLPSPKATTLRSQFTWPQGWATYNLDQLSQSMTLLTLSQHHFLDVNCIPRSVISGLNVHSIPLFFCQNYLIQFLCQLAYVDDFIKSKCNLIKMLKACSFNIDIPFSFITYFAIIFSSL